MHAHPADPKSFGDGRRTVATGVHLPDLLDRLRRLAALIDPLGISCFDPGLLPPRMNFRSRRHARHEHEDGEGRPSRLKVIPQG